MFAMTEEIRENTITKRQFLIYFLFLAPPRPAKFFINGRTVLQDEKTMTGGENSRNIISRFSNCAGSDVSKSASVLADIAARNANCNVAENSADKSGSLTSEQVEILRLQSENEDLRRICQQLQDAIRQTSSSSESKVFLPGSVKLSYAFGDYNL